MGEARQSTRPVKQRVALVIFCLFHIRQQHLKGGNVGFAFRGPSCAGESQIMESFLTTPVGGHGSGASNLHLLSLQLQFPSRQ